MIRSCPDEGVLADFLDEALTASVRFEIIEHLEQCERCRSFLDTTACDDWISEMYLDRASRSGDVDSEVRAVIHKISVLDPAELALMPADGCKTPTQPIEFPDPPTKDAPLGRLGRYSVVEQIGSGGTGILFRAIDAEVERVVALKVLRGELADRSSNHARLKREARVIGSLSHDHIVTLYEIVVRDDFPPCLVMEFVVGETLLDRMRRTGALRPNEAARIIYEIATALEAAHDQGLVHRDVKPANIMLDIRTGRAKLTDFGLARDSDDSDQLTMEGAIAGTPGYMSPEQIMSPQAIDGRSDIYSLGIVFYQVITGATPFQGDKSGWVQQTLKVEPRPPIQVNPRVPRDLQIICMKAIHKDPEVRYPSAAELADDLDRFLCDRPIKARPMSFSERFVLWCRRNKIAAAVFLLLLSTLSVVCFLCISFWSTYQQLEHRSDLAEKDLAATRQNEARIHRSASRMLENHRDTVELALTHLLRHNDEQVPTEQSLKQDLEEIDTIVGSIGNTLRHEWILIDAQHRSGEIALALGAPADAVVRFRRTLQKMAGAALQLDYSVRGQHRIGVCHAAIGRIALEAGKRDDASQGLELALRATEKVLKLSPGDPFGIYQQAHVYGLLGQLHERTGEVTEAIECYSQQRERMRVLTSKAESLQLQFELGMVALQIGILRLDNGAAKQAVPDLQEACDQFRQAEAWYANSRWKGVEDDHRRITKAWLDGVYPPDAGSSELIRYSEDQFLFDLVYCRPASWRRPPCRAVEIVLSRDQILPHAMLAQVLATGLEASTQQEEQLAERLTICLDLLEQLQEDNSAAASKIRKRLSQVIDERADLLRSLEERPATQQLWQQFQSELSRDA